MGMFCNDKIDQIDSCTFLGSIISKVGGRSQGPLCFSQLKNVWKKINLRNKIRMLEATVNNSVQVWF